MRKITAVLLCMLLTLSFFACRKSEEPYDIPSVPPTTLITPELTRLPTAVPVETPETKGYSFDETTRKYLDEYITFRLPEGFKICEEDTAEEIPEGTYIRYINFTNPESQASSVRYTVYTVDKNAGSLSDITREAIEQTLMQTYADAGIAAKIESIKFENSVLGGYKGISYEFKVLIAGVELNQIIRSVEKDGLRIEIVYTFSEPETDAFRISADSIALSQ